MKKVVVDTNIVVSSFMKTQSKPLDVMKLFYYGEIQLYYSEDILAEYKRVLGYRRLKIVQHKQDELLKAIKAKGILIGSPPSTIPLPDETDRTFYDTAKASGAILITGNLKHYPAEEFIMTPSGFLRVADEDT
jgi:putative PIN family toxin of toxin-antitoxin system